MATRRELATAIESNVSAFLMEMGRAGGGEQRHDDEVTWTVGGSPIGYHNAVVRCATRSPERLRELVDEWMAELRDRRLPGSWHATPEMPADTPGALLAAGFEDGGEEPAMAADLGVDPPPAPTVGSFGIERVVDEEGLDGYRTTLGDGFGGGPREADWVASVYAAIGLGDETPWRHYIGRVGDQPVCTATLFMTPPVAGIYFVSTRPHARQRGFGMAITRHAMVEAVTLGAATAVLGSSPMGHAVYQRLGFEDVFRYRLLEWEP